MMLAVHVERTFASTGQILCPSVESRPDNRIPGQVDRRSIRYPGSHAIVGPAMACQTHIYIFKRSKNPEPIGHFALILLLNSLQFSAQQFLRSVSSLQDGLTH